MGLFDRKLGVILTADTKRFERGLDRANRKVTTFGKSVQTAKGGVGSSFLMGRGGAALLGGGAAAVGITRMVNAAKDAQVVLGQTSVAVEDAGLSWKQSSIQINEAADRISKATAFDDEDVLRSFQVFVRGQKDVEKSLMLAELAADVARGRYTDLASATQLVNKAAMGQIGALRRAGIQIDKNATSAQALDALQRAYGRSAEEYASSAAGASDRLRVAWENLAEQAGNSLVPALTDVTNGLASVLEKMGAVQASSKDLFNEDFRNKFADAFGAKKLFEVLNQFTSEGLTSRPDEGSGAAYRSPKSGKGGKRSAPVMTREQSLLLSQLRAGVSTGLKDDLAAAQALAAFYKGKSGGAKNAKERFAATQAMIQAQQDIADIQQQMADATRADAQKQKDRLKRAADKARKAAKDLAESLAESADKFKDAVLRALDRKQDNVDTSRAVEDAKKALAQAKVLGGPETIKMARRALDDAQRARARFVAEGMNVKANKNGSFNVSGGIHLHGVTNVKQLVSELQRLGKQNAAPTTGRYPAHGHGGR